MKSNNTNIISHPTSKDVKSSGSNTKGTIRGGQTGTGKITPRGK